ncbi:TRAP transporter substrate-binding protein [Xanthobacteraceae bacterium Astr-EGSB]|uniref:TRAP transporter substrate-binding protein n=1 Tax=Astrobacterium formosum TaxID=3069710 RepID=UPI0027ADDEB3|nr:TRAP transporter substrate-binding protein [Xanthobacteraceae bacterium Astr-EGSB]
MLKKFMLSLIATGAVAAGLATSAVAQTKWDLPLVWPDANYIVKDARVFADKVKEATGGSLIITLHPGGSLGFKGPEMLAVVRDGLVPIGDMLLNQQVGEDKLLGIESLPYLIGSFDELESFHKKYNVLLEEIFAKNNQKILFSIPWPQQQIWTKKEIKTIADMKGIKIRSYDKSSTEIFAAAGMNPVQLPWGEVVPSIAAGVIDAVATSAPSAVDGAFWEFLKYGYPTRQTWNTDIVSVNLDAWKKLTDQQRKALVDVATALEPVFWADARKIDDDAMATLTKRGMIIGKIDDAMRKELRDRAAPLRETAAKAMGPRARAYVPEGK